MHVTSIQIACLLLGQFGTDPFIPAENSNTFEPKSVDLSPPANPRSKTDFASDLVNDPIVAPAAVIELSDEPSSIIRTPDEVGAQPNLGNRIPTEVTGTSQNSVVQANAEIETTSYTAIDTSDLAKSILSQACLPAQRNPIRGTPTKLIDVIASQTKRQSQLSAIRRYWRLSLALADHNHASMEYDLIANVSPPQSVLEKSLLDAAIAAAAARVKESSLAAVGIQHDLVNQLSRKDDESLPIPDDSPFVGPYRTKFDDIFRGRSVPAGVHKLNDTLPRTLELIYARAAACEATRHALATSIAAYNDGQVPINFVVESFEKMRGQRIGFLAAVRDYNILIAEYAMNVASPSLSNDKIVSMLIVVPSNTESAGQPIRRTAQNDRSILRSSDPTTLAPVPTDQGGVGVVRVKPQPITTESDTKPAIQPNSSFDLSPAGDGFVPRQDDAPQKPPTNSFEFDGE